MTSTSSVSVATEVCVAAWGDAWTNLIQPFWALPVLAIAGLKAKLIGYVFSLINRQFEFYVKI